MWPRESDYCRARRGAISTTSTRTTATTPTMKSWRLRPPRFPTSRGGSIPPALAGKLYPHGIPIFEEARLAELITEYGSMRSCSPTATCPTPT